MPALRVRYGLTKLSLFGSAARGDARPDSDIDLLVSFDPNANVTLLTLGRIKTELEALLGATVDLIENHGALPARFKAAIARDAVPVV
jgi:predicted nucleotidyltransferase